MNKLEPASESRPWGGFREFVKNTPVTVKITSVKAGESFSLQRHQKRSEFWRVLSGTPEITVGEVKTQANSGDEFNIPAGTNHRVSAIGVDAEILEISLGEFDENDIVRIEDKYGRA